MRTNYFSLFLFISILFTAAAVSAQTSNFDETWKEFLENDKISNMSRLSKPNKAYKKQEYAKYLLMNINTDFCQSDVENAEILLAEIKSMDAIIYKPIVGFASKMSNLEVKIKAYHSMDAIWQRFLKDKAVTPSELEAVKGAKTLCEKQTLAKYSYMTAYHNFCQGDVAKAKNIFEKRTLQLAEKTTLRIEEVEGLAPEVAKMKSLFQNMTKLDTAWDKYLDSGVSPGFDIDLPLFSCYPVPNMKALILRGTADLCEAGEETIAEIKKLAADSGVTPDGELAEKLEELEDAVKEQDEDLAYLNKAWEAFLPDSKVLHKDYSHDFCEPEPLIRAYIMDGYTFVCDLAEIKLQEIEDLQKSAKLELDEETLIKIKELGELSERYQLNGEEIEDYWKKFTAQGDTLYEDYISIEMYCDNIDQIKDWVIGGNCSDCEERSQYMQKIDAFQKTFEFSFTEDLECQVQNLRVKLWDCRYKILVELATLEVSDDPIETRLERYLTEYEMGVRPEVCTTGK